MSLLEEMRRRRVNAMIADACYLAGKPSTGEQAEAVEQERRRAMYERALGRITDSEKQAIFQILEKREEE
jgi:hypothetical protein